jgi:hypothetical protein
MISLYLTISTRKKDSTDNILNNKKENLYIPLYKDFLKIIKVKSTYNFTDPYLYNSNNWSVIKECELFLDIPKHINKWMEEYHSCLAIYEITMADFNSLCTTNRLLKSIKENENLQSLNPIIAYLQDYFLKNKEYIVANQDKYRIGTIENILVQNEKRNEILNMLTTDISKSNEYLHLLTQKQELDKKAEELYEMFKYIIKLINSRYYTSIEYI